MDALFAPVSDRDTQTDALLEAEAPIQITIVEVPDPNPLPLIAHMVDIQTQTEALDSEDTSSEHEPAPTKKINKCLGLRNRQDRA